MKTAAWKSLIAKCPTGWADGVKEGDCDMLLRTKSEGKKSLTHESGRFGSDRIMSPHIAELIKMIESNDSKKIIIAARKIARTYSKNSELLEIVNEELLKGYQKN